VFDRHRLASRGLHIPRREPFFNFTCHRWRDDYVPASDERRRGGRRAYAISFGCEVVRYLAAGYTD